VVTTIAHHRGSRVDDEWPNTYQGENAADGQAEGTQLLGVISFGIVTPLQ
jgi:hypothetical protein